MKILNLSLSLAEMKNDPLNYQLELSDHFFYQQYVS